mgnify:CR=1 FL=1
MNAEHAIYAQWDAAYVLGALSPTDRAGFEEHLETCRLCRAAVVELSPTVGLLSRVKPDVAANAVTHDAQNAQARAALATVSRARARRRWRTRWTLAVAAAVVVAVTAVGVPMTLSALDRPATAFALQDVGGVPLQASVQLTPVRWGTRIALDCLYPGPAGAQAPGAGWTYELAVVGSDGRAATVSTWRASPGARARIDAGTALELSGIRAVEIRAGDGQVLMRRDLPTGIG